MNRQLARKALVICLLIGSAYITAGLLYLYVSVIMGWINGAGAAQWQFGFATAPAPIILGVAALVLTRLPSPPLSSKYTVCACVAAGLPAALAALVLAHVY